MLFMPSDHIYVDESKARGHFLVATASSASAVSVSDKSLRTLLKPGQRRIHFKSESDARRRSILSRMVELDVRASVWVAKGKREKEARDLCIESMSVEACRSRIRTITVERDDSLVGADRRIISRVLAREGVRGIRYDHSAPQDYPLLWISDAVAWCHSRGGDWTRRVQPLVEGRVTRL